MNEAASFNALMTASPDIDANDFVVAKEMADILHTTYPGHIWAVNVQNGFADVRNLALSGSMGYRIKQPSVYSASEMKRRVVRAGGEILERYRVRRGRHHVEDISSLQVDFAGRHKADT